MTLIAAPQGTLAGERFPWPALEAEQWKPAGGGERDAVLIAAIERYTYYPQDPISGARKNAEAWFDYFHKARGVPIKRIELLRDTQVTRKKLQLAVQQLAKETPAGGTAWFVFIGHGAPSRDGKDAQLITLNAQQTPDSIEEESVSRSFVETALSKADAARAVLVLDTCFSGTGTSGRKLAKGLQNFEWQQEPAGAPAKVTVLTAASQGQYAGPLPSGDRPAFSYLALGALRGWATQGQGPVTASDVQSFTGLWLRKIVGDRDQTPTLRGDGAIVLGAGWERGPNLGDVVRHTGGRPQSSVATAPIPRPDGELVAEALANAERSEAGRDVGQKVAAWERLLALGKQNPHLALARRKVSEWRASDATRREIERLAGEAWKVVAEKLASDSMGAAEKRELLERFARDYGGVAPYRDEVAAARRKLTECPAGMVFVPGAAGTPKGQPSKAGDFCMDRTEVTTAAFTACVESGRCTTPATKPSTCNYLRPDRANHPINCVDWSQASVFCRAEGARLPTDAEWEWAATGGARAFPYPWGTQAPSSKLLNACGSECGVVGQAPSTSGWPAMHEGDDGYPHTAPVGSFPGGASADGILDLAGNVREWLATVDHEEASMRAVRGGSWLNYRPSTVGAKSRESLGATLRADNLGFRCLRSR